MRHHGGKRNGSSCEGPEMGIFASGDANPEAGEQEEAHPSPPARQGLGSVEAGVAPSHSLQGMSSFLRPQKNVCE